MLRDYTLRFRSYLMLSRIFAPFTTSSISCFFLFRGNNDFSWWLKDKASLLCEFCSCGTFIDSYKLQCGPNRHMDTLSLKYLQSCSSWATSFFVLNKRKSSCYPAQKWLALLSFACKIIFKSSRYIWISRIVSFLCQRIMLEHSKHYFYTFVGFVVI